jgi:hypothetical protein
LTYIAAFLAGLLLSGVWAWYIRVVAAGNANAAALSDGVLLILTFAQYQLWASRGNDWKVFAVITAGSMLGTKLYMEWKNVQRRRDVAVSNRYAGKRTPPPCAS